MNIRRLFSLFLFAIKYGIAIIGPFIIIAIFYPDAPRWTISTSLVLPFLLIVGLVLTRNIPHPNWKTRLFVSLKISAAFLFLGVLFAMIFIFFQKHGL